MKILAFLALGYAALVLLMYSIQDQMAFPGTRLASRPIDLPHRPERLVVEAGDGASLAGMVFSPENGQGSKGLLMAFGGNAQDAEILGQDLAGALSDRHVAVFHYRGYGPSTGSPSERALFADAVTIHDRLVSDLAPKTVLAMGLSLGSGIAAYLSTERDLDGILLVTPYDSIEAVARQSYPWLPVGPLLKHRFRTVDLMAANRTPVAIIAAENDRVIRPVRTDALRKSVERLVFDRTVAGAGHGDLYAMPAYDEAFQDALRALERAGETD